MDPRSPKIEPDEILRLHREWSSAPSVDAATRISSALMERIPGLVALARSSSELRMAHADLHGRVGAIEQQVLNRDAEIDRLRDKIERMRADRSEGPTQLDPPTKLSREDLWFLVQGVCHKLGIPVTDHEPTIEAALDRLIAGLADETKRANENRDARRRAEDRVRQVANAVTRERAEFVDGLARHVLAYIQRGESATGVEGVGPRVDSTEPARPAGVNGSS